MDTGRNTTKVEILAPAGSFETLQAVIEAGADAVYIGGSRFGARAYADNPEEDTLLQAIDYAHLRGVRVYLTVNTLLTDREMEELFAYINPYYKAGLDACIVQDMGVLSFLRLHFPKMPIHLSTQMTVTDAEAADLFDKGVTRIVPARELSLAEIRAMRKATDRELEIFVHGALCYCYSGQCLMSSLIGGRSGNRGRCAQPCRKEYTYEESGVLKSGYLLSPKDQCLLPRLHELLETGIHSLKIEGRMKRLEYAAGVTAIYRKWVDRYYEMGHTAYITYLKGHASEMETDVRELAVLFNRGGFCEGYVFDRKGPDMMCVKRPNHSGVLVGTAKVRTNGIKVSAVPSFTEIIGPREVFELRTEDERFTCGEWTTPKEMNGYTISSIPVLWKKEYGINPERLNIWRMKKATLLDELANKYGDSRKPIPINGIFVAIEGEEMSLTIQSADERISVTQTVMAAENAKNAAATEESVREKLMKTGGSAYAFSELQIFLSEGLFIPVSVLNELRRKALEQYTKEYLETFRREDGIESDTPEIDVRQAKKGEAQKADASDTCPRIIASVMTAEQLQPILVNDAVTDIYIDMEGAYEACLQSKSEKNRFLLLPRALKGTMRNRVCAEAKALCEKEKLSGIVVRTVDQLAYFQKTGIRIETDKTLYCMNSTAVEELQKRNVSAITLSEELRRDELPHGKDVILTVYGRSVAMVSEQCPRKTLDLCGKNEGRTAIEGNVLGVLTDGEHAHFPTRSVCRYCHSLLYNSHVMSLLTVMQEVPLASLAGIRLDFTMETSEETEDILAMLCNALAGNPVQAMADTTKGHWNRGVE